ncbi:hypothetical protein K503DRAFT_801499 [Rhizopogon vinicolor AM-OR11-026]|uniref:Ricin B lectin domain-containing protein n=1 Tax=Rhizopogon vinicolor AM-OR11-026 TaxID=1314800 RepID=A0A1B7MWW6_9AGAM|nr:hypothetical protein K503DRAFT_801499 [Rhizopogon vinicolor AM-OR11-026]
MSIPLPGTYRLRSVKFPNQLFDLSGGGINPGTPVVGYANNSGSQNMLWTMQVVDASNKIVRLINVASGTFAQGAGSQAGAGMVGNPAGSAALFKVVPRNNLGEYVFQTTDGQLACSLANANNFTQVTLQKVDANDSSQGWIFCPV